MEIRINPSTGDTRAGSARFRGPETRRWEVDGLDARSFRFAGGAALDTHEHDRPALIGLAAGAFSGSVDRRPYGCASGELVLLPAAVAHRETIGPLGACSIVLRPSDEAAEDWKPIEPLTPMRSPELRRLLWRLGTELAVGSPEALVLEELTLELVAVAAGDTEIAAVPSHSIAERARDLIEAHYTEPLTLDGIARQCGASRAHLTRSFRARIGCSVGELVRNRRLDRAARLLAETALPIRDVAVDCGFYDQSHLSNAFRRWFGCPPRTFRELQAVAGKNRRE